MIVQHNITALNAYRNSQLHGNQMAKSLQRLSSGYRINSAADDPAGLGVSERMRGQIREMKMSVRNAQDAISMLQTAEGGLMGTHEILQRMRELAVQATNGTYTDDQRKLMDIEYQSLVQEITRISDSTNYNGIRVLDGTAGGTTGQNSLETVGLTGLSVHGVEGTMNLTFAVEEDGSGLVRLRVGENVYTAEFSADDILVTFVVDDGHVDLQFDAGALRSGLLNGVQAKDDAVDYSNARAGNVDTALAFQVGSWYEKVQSSIGNSAAENLGGKNGSVYESGIATAEKARSAIDVLDEAINQVSKSRGSLGAQINGLIHTINYLEVSIENLTEAESLIRDVDMAEEMMNYVKHSLLYQASQFAMTHANQQQQSIVGLLLSM